MKKLFLPVALLLAASSIPASSAIILFNLVGRAGVGLLSGNENGIIAGTPGSGGEVGAGITYDDATNVLTLNVAWGTANSFDNLSGPASAGHIHGPTPSSGSAAFLENVGVLFNLDSGPTWNNSATAGGITNRTLNLTEPQEAELLAGRYYVNVHTTTNSGGEIRGNLVVVPEPSASILGLAGIAALGWRRRTGC